MSFGRKWIKVEGYGRAIESHIKDVGDILFTINRAET